MMKKIYTLMMIACCFGFVQNSNAQCPAGEIEVFIDVITDTYGYEVYWELVPSGNPCGTGTIFAGGNTAVGCGGGGAQVQSLGGYAANSTITEGGFCLVIGQDYDIIAVDDWGDGGTCFEIVGGQTFCQGGSSANDVFTFNAQPPADHDLVVKITYYDTLMIPNATADSMSTQYYTQIPRRQAEMDLLFFSGQVKNSGGMSQTNLEFTATVNDGTNNVFLGSKSATSLASGVTDTMMIGKSFTAVANGTYDVTFEVAQDSTDFMPADNIVLETFVVNDSVYARDNGDVAGGTGWWYGAGQNYEIGIMYEIFTTDTATSISYYNWTVTASNIGVAGNVIQLNVYDAAGFGAFTPICSTGFYTLVTADEDSWITVDLDGGPFELPPGQYVVTVETFSDQLFTSSNSNGDPLTCYVDPDNGNATWFYTLTVPMVRLNVAYPAACNLAVTGTSTDLNCAGANDGTATVTATGGTAPYTYLWDDQSATTNAALTGVGGGMYNALVTDAAGCMYQMAFDITEPDVTTISLMSTDITCNGGTDGAITVAVSGGTAPFTYTWSDMSLTGGSVTGLSAGTYAVTVDDANGCAAASDSATIIEPASMALAFTQNTANCGLGGSASVSVTGGVAPYSYLWDDGLAQTTATATDLLSDEYTCTVTDSNGCVASVTDSVQGTPLVTVTIAKNDPSACGLLDGDATVTIVTGTLPYFYSWDDPGSQNTATAVGLAIGIYNVTVTDAVPCMTTASITLLDPGAATLQTSTVDVMCLGGNDGTASVLTSGGTSPFNYSWNTSPAQTGTTATGLAAGYYTVTVVDASGCSSFATDTVTEPSTAVAIDAIAVTDVTCNGDADGNLTVTSSGGTGTHTYAWTGGPATATYSGVGGGIYTVAVTDANGCTATDSGLVAEPAALTVSTTVTDITCNGDADGAVDLTVTGGTGAGTYGFLWNPGGATTEDLSGQGPGAYSVMVTDNNGCTAITAVTISEPAALVAVVDNYTDETVTGANDGTINASATGGTGAYTALWIGPGGFISTSMALTGLAPGTYQLTLNDANGCSATLTQIIAPGQVTACSVTSSFISSTTTICEGETVNFTNNSTGAIGYNWLEDGIGFATTTNTSRTFGTAGTFTISLIADSASCGDTSDVSITVNPLPTIDSELSTDASACGVSDGTITVTASGGTAPLQYSINGGSSFSGSNSFSGLSAGNYDIAISDSVGCLVMGNTITVTAPGAPSVATTSTNPTGCGTNDGTATVTATGGTSPYTYSWSNGGNTATITGLTGGTYTVTVTDTSSCTVNASVILTEPTAPSVTATGTDPTSCGTNDGTATATATGGTSPYTYSWSNSAITSGITGLTGGTYALTVTDANSCTANTSVTLSAPGTPTLTMVNTDLDCYGDNNGTAGVTVSGGISPYTYNWSNGQTVSIITGLPSGLYSVTVTDGSACIATGSVTILEPLSLTTNITVVDASCINGNDGSADLSVSGGTSPYGFSWSTGSATEDLSGLTAGTYTVEVTDSNGCTTVDTAIIDESSVGPQTGNIIGLLQVNPFDQEQYSVSQTLGSSYNWTATGGNITSGQGTNVVQIQWGSATMGQIAVIETDSAGCVGDTVTLEVQIGTSSGIAAHAASLEMLIYPNPFTHATTVVFSNEEKVPFKLVLYDMLGNKVRVMHDITASEVVVEKGSLAPGEYFIELQGMAKIFRGRLMVE